MGFTVNFVKGRLDARSCGQTLDEPQIKEQKTQFVRVTLTFTSSESRLPCVAGSAACRLAAGGAHPAPRGRRLAPGHLGLICGSLFKFLIDPIDGADRAPPVLGATSSRRCRAGGGASSALRRAERKSRPDFPAAWTPVMDLSFPPTNQVLSSVTRCYKVCSKLLAVTSALHH